MSDISPQTEGRTGAEIVTNLRYSYILGLRSEGPASVITDYLLSFCMTFGLKKLREKPRQIGARTCAARKVQSPQAPLVELDEIRGLDLKTDIGSAEALQHMMLSVLCLHHYMHEQRNDMDFEAWKTLQSSQGTAGEIPDELLYKIWRVVRKEALPQLSVPGLTGSSGGSHSLKIVLPEADGTSLEEGDKTLLENVEQTEQSLAQSEQIPWLQGLPSLQGWLNVSTPGLEADVKGRLWASVCLGLLFFSLSPRAAAPEAFVSLSGVFPSWDGGSIILEKWRSIDGKSESSSPSNNFVTGALLKPDGSWKECNFLKVELGLTPQEDPQSWLSWLGSIENTRSWV